MGHYQNSETTSIIRLEKIREKKAIIRRRRTPIIDDNRKHQYTPQGTIAVTWLIVGKTVNSRGTRIKNIGNSRGTRTKDLQSTLSQIFRTVTQKRSATSWR